jgi:pimeloyl-ACP methyl ester carboxylesterase
MADDAVYEFLAAAIEERLAMVLDSRYEAPLKQYLGVSLFEQYVELANRLPDASEAHLGAKTPKNLIFVPGVMGSLLQSQSGAGVWWVDFRALGHLNDLKLSEDGQEDANPYFDVNAFGVDASYDALLRIFMNRDDFGVIRLPYDWRKPLVSCAADLRATILKTYEENGHTPVHLLAHSMGGLLVRATLMQYGNELWPKLGKIAFLGTPHYGSPAIAGYLKGHLWGFELLALLGLYLSRATFRSLWGVISMLPAPVGVYPGTRGQSGPGGAIEHPCANFDMYDAASWKLDLAPEEAVRLQEVLDGAALFHRNMFKAHKALPPEFRERMAVIAGVGYDTLFRLEFASDFWGLWNHTRKITSRVPGQPGREGDGRVPLPSASLEVIGETRYVRAEHGKLPVTPAVYEDALRWFKGEPMTLPKSAEEALSPAAHLGDAGAQEALPRVDMPTVSSTSLTDPGYWQTEPPDPARIEQLKRRLEAGELPEFHFLHLL